MKPPKDKRRLHSKDVFQEGDYIEIDGVLFELKYRNMPLIGDFIGRLVGKYDVGYRKIK